ncbi:hypothetical protein BT69DRAFT_1244942 [Atractiella rhizophila]|nr:hypothetical protein BT69DRAFT_1244942 [Atractiella rhizophila]
MKLILAGATGLVGSEVLRQALSSSHVEHITVLSRRPLPASVPSSSKLTVHVLTDFTKYDPALLVGHTACIWALGPSSRGMNEMDYTMATYTYPMEFAKAVLKSREMGEPVEGGKFNMIYVSGEGARQDETSYAMFGRIKGRAEKHLIELAPDKIISLPFRPSFIFPHRGWSAFSLRDKVLFPIVKPLASTINSEWEITDEEVAKGLLWSAWKGEREHNGGKRGEAVMSGEIKRLGKKWDELNRS